MCILQSASSPDSPNSTIQNKTGEHGNNYNQIMCSQVFRFLRTLKRGGSTRTIHLSATGSAYCGTRQRPMTVQYVHHLTYAQCTCRYNISIITLSHQALILYLSETMFNYFSNVRYPGWVADKLTLLMTSFPL